MKSVTAIEVDHKPDTPFQSQKAEKKSGKRIGYNYIILKSLKESRKNDVVKCVYIKSLTKFGICVIKEGSYGESKDKYGRDIKDRLVWQKQLHEFLQDKVRIPHSLGSFEENGNYYLVLEHIKGKSLYKVCRERSKDLREGLIAGNKTGITFLNYMIQLISLLENLHRNQVIHRDVTATNFMITPSGKVAVIDLELSYSLQQQFPTPPFQLGTHGYMSPEQEATQTPALEQDTFSAAAVILQVWTGISPNKLTNAPIKELADKVHFFIPDKAFADIIIECLHPNPEQRPALPAVRQVITSYKEDLRKKNIRPTATTKLFGREEILDTVQQAIGTLSSPLLADKEKGWFSLNSNVSQTVVKNEINKAWYASFSKGACGVIYLLSRANKLGIDVEIARPFIDKGLELIELKYINRINKANPGLYFGSSGIAAVLATVMQEGLVEPHTAYFEWINRLLEKDNQVFGFQDGIAGQGMAHWLCHPFLDAEKVHGGLTVYVNRLLNAQEKDGSWIRSTGHKKRRVTRGFAHGMAGITYFLLEFAEHYTNKEALEAAQRGLHWLMKKAVHQEKTIQWRSSADKEISPWWSEGSTGIALTFIKAYALSGEVKYKEYAAGALYNHNKKVIDNNLTQSHGLSGLGEIYLEAFHVLKDEEWRERADWIVQVLMHVKKQHTAHGPYWLVEHERQPVADFMSGNSGILHFLLRYCYPDRVGFPLLA